MSETNPWVHVELLGHGTFWIGEKALRGEDESALAPEEHIEDGELIPSMRVLFLADSYAHAYPDGSIMRYGQKIGEITDLVRL